MPKARTLAAAELDRLRLIRHDAPERHELRVKQLQLRRERLEAERAGNVRNELNRLVAHYRRIMPNAVGKMIKRRVAHDFLRVHGHLPQ